jgi:hypothetical protein
MLVTLQVMMQPACAYFALLLLLLVLRPFPSSVLQPPELQ